MRPISCKNCGSVEIETKDDHYYCPFCETKYPRAKAQPTTVIKEIHYVPVDYVDNTSVEEGKKRNKWIALLIWYFLGVVGGHKFYDGKFGMGILYLFTAGLFGIGWLIDLFVILAKPTTYYV